VAVAQSPARADALASASRADASTGGRAGSQRATSVADSIAARAGPPPVVTAPEVRSTVPISTGPASPTSPMLIGAAPQPPYPVALRDQRIEGDVVVQFVVDETGRPDVSSTTVVRSPHVLLTNAVLAILPQLRFEPARTAPPQSIPRPETVRRVFTFRAPRP
jgi:TonB family protein